MPIPVTKSSRGASAGFTAIALPGSEMILRLPKEEMVLEPGMPHSMPLWFRLLLPGNRASRPSSREVPAIDIGASHRELCGGLSNSLQCYPKGIQQPSYSPEVLGSQMVSHLPEQNVHQSG